MTEVDAIGTQTAAISVRLDSVIAESEQHNELMQRLIDFLGDGLAPLGVYAFIALIVLLAWRPMVWVLRQAFQGAGW